MTVDFDILKRNELRAAVELVGRAFEDYEYFTNYFPDLKERRKVLGGVVYDSIEDIWPDYPTKEDFLFNEDEY